MRDSSKRHATSNSPMVVTLLEDYAHTNDLEDGDPHLVSSALIVGKMSTEWFSKAAEGDSLKHIDEKPKPSRGSLVRMGGSA